MKITYVEKRFTPGSLALIETANQIIEDYEAQGFDLTLRQLYYQMVARDIIANVQTEYKRLGSILNDARLAGLVSWSAIVDRTRELRQNSHWSSPGDILQSAAASYLEDRWSTQPCRVEVWIEKDALVGVIAGVCERYDVPFFSCRGYVSQSEMWAAGHRRLRSYQRAGQKIVVLHLGDHDPSGIDMSRDIEERLGMFSGYADLTVDRLALNMDQIEELGPPPNPAKVTDSRARDYIAEHGTDSWELDALEPAYITSLIETRLDRTIDRSAWDEVDGRIRQHQETLQAMADRYDELQDLLGRSE